MDAEAFNKLHLMHLADMQTLNHQFAELRRTVAEQARLIDEIASKLRIHDYREDVWRELVVFFEDENEKRRKEKQRLVIKAKMKKKKKASSKK